LWNFSVFCKPKYRAAGQTILRMVSAVCDRWLAFGGRPAARSLPLNKVKKEKRHTLPTMG